jgi:hypothetical protein|tara:strand:- start:512 stop:622 length:111 start_codon:yes stop_codon:yes gene_type:complete
LGRTKESNTNRETEKEKIDMTGRTLETVETLGTGET